MICRPGRRLSEPHQERNASGDMPSTKTMDSPGAMVNGLLVRVTAADKSAELSSNRYPLRSTVKSSRLVSSHQSAWPADGGLVLWAALISVMTSRGRRVTTSLAWLVADPSGLVATMA